MSDGVEFDSLEEVVDAAERRLAGAGTVPLLVWPGEDDLVVFAHATGFHKELWAPVVRSLRVGGVAATLAALDLAGHGDAPEPDHAPTIWGFGGNVVTAIDELRPRGRVVGVGHSLGGAAVLAAELAAGVLDGAVVLDPAVVAPELMAAFLAAGGNPWAEGARRRRPGFGSRDEAFAVFSSKRVFASWPTEVLRLYVDHGMAATDEGWSLKCRPAWEAATFSQPDLVEVWERLPELDLPVVLVTGGSSDTHPEPYAEALAARLGARHVRLAGVGHFIPMEVPDAVAAEVARLLGTGR